LPTIGQSSLDTLNESMQLSSEITGYQLLLNGAISDQIQAASGMSAGAKLGHSAPRERRSAAE
jgi:hypothetical protein